MKSGGPKTISLNSGGRAKTISLKYGGGGGKTIKSKIWGRGAKIISLKSGERAMVFWPP